MLEADVPQPPLLGVAGPGDAVSLQCALSPEQHVVKALCDSGLYLGERAWCVCCFPHCLLSATCSAARMHCSVTCSFAALGQFQGTTFQAAVLL